MTLCLLDDIAGAERIYPAKIFELMHLGRPVFTLAPPGSALARLVQRHRLGPLAHPRDEAAIATTVEAQLRAFQRGDNPAVPWRTRADVERYDRRALAGEFAEILREAASSAHRSGSWPIS
jgi:glycosyltransferase involved in cell wall biosynthesis